ncbi:alpha/beta hydrolase [Halalkalibacter hemicellulosilyticus]|uniref:alpha/beta hydrolase n=1 Tax=Halalkalibacter hemicellulosilyticus TaxID=127886 RepID=UPI0005529035|nr:alpha/beta hydrolase [Halalkalibacter hemicellulosilyticus]
MIHKTITIQTKHTEVPLYTYFLNQSPEIDPERKRPIVIVCPGGSYERTSDREAEPVAIKFNAMGFHACVLRYSVKPAPFPTSLFELAKTVALIRENATEWNVDTSKIIVAGFSAGGHLAASLGVFWKESFLAESLDVSSDELKPNGLLLSYPVISSTEYAHKGSFRALLGDKYKELLPRVSLENHVTAHTPPTFLWHTYTDEAVPVQNSFMFAQALLKYQVPLEMHIYPRGIHGLSLGTEETKAYNNQATVQGEVANWIDMAGVWIRGL